MINTRLTPVSIWVNQTREDDSSDRELWASVGHVEQYKLSQPDALGIRSKVSPGIACWANLANGGDCIVAYVDQEQEINQVRIARLRIQQGTERYHVVADHQIAQLPGNLRTGHNIDAWYHDDKFWVAIKPIRTVSTAEAVEVLVYESNSWSLAANLDYTVSGPSAISYWMGNNQLFFFR